MKTPLILSVATAALLSVNLQADENDARIEKMAAQIEQLQDELDTLKAGDTAAADEASEEDDEGDDEEEDEGDDTAERLDDLEDQVSNINKNTAGNHLKFGIDFRTSFDNLQYKMADDQYDPATGQKIHDKSYSNDALLSNRLWINMEWLATENLSFTGQLAYNKFYGQRSGVGYAPFETFDWVTNENPYDDTIRVRSAYFFYRNDTFLGADVPWTFSLGRRPSTNGHLINYRDDDRAASPMAHTINVEFDGLSSKFSLEELTWEGQYIKFCAGRGLTNATGKFFSVSQDPQNPTLSVNTMNTPYVENEYDLPNIDMVGLIWVPYDDGQYTIGAQYTYAWNLIDAQVDPATMQFQGMENVGNLQTVTANLNIYGIGNEWSDFLDETIFFVSGAATITDPRKSGQGMLGDMTKPGSQYDSQTGYSAWVGLQIPSLLTEEGRWGAEWNWGSKYWRPITYAEDTLVGSKIATRGNAYEVYFTEPLIDNVLTFQLRYTYLDYDYSGSNGFFGSTSGNSTSLDTLKNMGLGGMYVDTAQDIRAYLRYRY